MSCFITADDRGIGVKTLTNLKEGDFIIEYCGEVIDSIEFEIRSSKSKTGNDFYAMRITPGILTIWF
jgi:SET domain-containing protein